MKKRILIIINILCLSVLSYGQEPLTEARAFYDAGEYAEAIALYDSLLAVNPSAELEYNIANAYYKAGEIGSSILHYERALRIRPSYSDAKYNLKIAQQRIVDDLKNDNETLLSVWIMFVIRSLTEQDWIIFSLITFFLFLIGVITFSFVRSVPVRKTGFYVACVAILFSITTFIFAGVEHKENREQRDAIVMQSIVSVKSSPDKSGTDIFVLHEGTKVHIRSVLSDWAEIQVSDNVGWIRQSCIERI